MNDLLPAIIDLSAATEPALPKHITASAREYVKESRAERTRKAYSFAWRQFSTWCTVNGRCVLPASPETVAAWIVCLADGSDGGKARSKATISLYMAAVTTAQRTAGHVFDRSNAVLVETWRGISSVKARTDIERQADAALRRSKLVGLDWQKKGKGVGSLRIDERGSMVTLATSKGSQDAAASVIIPAADAPTTIARLAAWASLAQLQPGQSVFRSIDKAGRISPTRLGDGAVATIVKRRVRAYAIERGKSKAEADQLAAMFSGHSMRSGFATTAADLPPAQLALHTLHKSLEVQMGYIRERESWRKSALKSVGFWPKPLGAERTNRKILRGATTDPDPESSVRLTFDGARPLLGAKQSNRGIASKVDCDPKQP